MIIGKQTRALEAVLDKQDPQMIVNAADGFLEFLDDIERMM